MVKTEGKVLGKDFAVVDVRGDDYAGGHIKGALHQSSKTFAHGGVEAIRDKTKDVPRVIFHCLLSQVRFVCLTLSACLTSDRSRLPGAQTRPRYVCLHICLVTFL